MRELAHRHHLQLSIEPYAVGLMDNFSYARMADVPMCEFWTAGDETGDRGNKTISSAAPHLRQADLRRRIVHFHPAIFPLARSSLRDEGAGRRGLLRRRQPLRDPPLLPSSRGSTGSPA